MVSEFDDKCRLLRASPAVVIREFVIKLQTKPDSFTVRVKVTK